MADFQQTLNDVLSTSKIFLNYPSKTSLGDDLYSSVQRSEIQVSKRRRFTGKIKVSSNSLSLQGVSTFQLDPGVILGKCYIYGKATFPQHSYGPDGWAWPLIKSVEFKCSGSSSIQNLKVSGRSMFDMIMATTNSKDKRDLLIKTGGRQFHNSSGAASHDFCIPIYMLFSSADSSNTFPFDSATIRSQLAFSLEWEPMYTSVTGTVTYVAPPGPDVNHAVVLPTSFDELFLRVHNSVELEDKYLANAMAKAPWSVYSLPALYYQTYQTQCTINSLSDEIQISLTSFPIGMLQCIIFSLIPQAWVGDSTTLTWTHNVLSANLSSLRVLYNGQVLYEVNSQTENELVNCLQDDGGSCVLDQTSSNSTYEYANPATAGLEYNNYQSMLNIIPLGNEISNILRGKCHENLPSYSGSTIQIFFKVSSLGQVYQSGNFEQFPFHLAQPTGVYNLNFTYVLAALVETQNGTMSLQLE